MRENKLLERVAVMTIILAIFFAALQIIPEDKTYNSIIPETILKVISISFFSTILLVFLIYFILVAINLGYNMENTIPKGILKWIYNVSILITFFIVFFTVGFSLLINLLILFPIHVKIATYILISFLILTAICFGKVLSKY